LRMVCPQVSTVWPFDCAEQGSIGITRVLRSIFPTRQALCNLSQSVFLYMSLCRYQRTNNPTRAAFEMAIAAAEGGKHSISFASGMAATAAILHLLKSGDRIIAMDDMYGGTHRYMIRTAAPTYGMKFEFVDLTDPAKLEAALAAEPAKLVWLETPTNPTLKISDISAIAKICKAHGALLAVDNTFMSPHFQ